MRLTQAPEGWTTPHRTAYKTEVERKRGHFVQTAGQVRRALHYLLNK